MTTELVELADRLMLIAADVETMTVVLPPVGQRNITSRVADLRACADSILAIDATKPAGWIPKWQLNGKPWAWTAHDEESAAGLTGLVPLYLHPAPVNKASGVVSVEEANLVPHVHPERGPGYFFNETLKGSPPATELRALASRAAVPDGFVLVPREPTEAMGNAARHWQHNVYVSDPMGDPNRFYFGFYRAMIAAAPEPLATKEPK